MKTTFVPLLVLWGLMAASVLVLIVWRKVVSRGEDDSLHVLHAEVAVPHQAAVAHKLDQIDKWGKMLTVATVVYGLALAALYFYQVWTTASTTILGA